MIPLYALVAASCTFDSSSLDTACNVMHLAGTCLLPCRSVDGKCAPIFKDAIASVASTMCSANVKTPCIFPCSKSSDDDDDGDDDSLLGGGGGNDASSPPPPPPLAASSPPPLSASFDCRVQGSAPPMLAFYYTQTCPDQTVGECRYKDQSGARISYCCCAGTACAPSAKC